MSLCKPRCRQNQDQTPAHSMTQLVMTLYIGNSTLCHIEIWTVFYKFDMFSFKKKGGALILCLVYKLIMFSLFSNFWYIKICHHEYISLKVLHF